MAGGLLGEDGKKNSKKAESHKENRTETRARAPSFLALIVLSSAL